MTVRSVGCELIVTLGILGETGKAAAPVLRQIANGEDARQAALARAALRSIEGS